jgi:ribosome modulation factor
MSVDFVSEMSKVITSNDSELAICRTSINLDSGEKILRAYKQNATVADHILNVMINTVSFMASRELLERTGGWDGELKAWDDYELGVRLLLEAKKVEWVNREFHNVYWHKESITGDTFGRIFKDIMLCLKKINGQSLDKCAYNALYLKSMIVAGWLKREKKNDYVSELRHWAKSSIPNVNKQNRLLGAFLYHYTALGLRGAWKIAMMANN